MPYKTKQEKNAAARRYYQKHPEKFAAKRKAEAKWQREYNRKYYQLNQETIKEHVNQKYHERRRRDPEGLKAEKRRNSDIIAFGHTREEVFAIKGNKCCCGKKAQLIHHMDWDGKPYRLAGLKPGTKISRLQPMCRRCHRMAHDQDLLVARLAFYAKWWSPKYRLKNCRICKRSEPKHYRHGYCYKCYPYKKQGPGV